MANDPAAIYACLAVGILCGGGLLVIALVREAVESYYAKRQRDKFGYK